VPEGGLAHELYDISSNAASLIYDKLTEEPEQLNC